MLEGESLREQSVNPEKKQPQLIKISFWDGIGGGIEGLQPIKQELETIKAETSVKIEM